MALPANQSAQLQGFLIILNLKSVVLLSLTWMGPLSMNLKVTTAFHNLFSWDWIKFMIQGDQLL